MRENWLDPFRYKDIEKLVNGRCKKPEHLSVLFASSKEGEKNFFVQYLNSGVNHEINIGEFGEMHTLNPFDNVDFFKMAKKKNTGRIIDGLTFDQAFIKAYEDAIFDYRDQLFDLAKAETDEREYSNKLYQAEDIYALLMERVEKFAEKYKIEPFYDDEVTL